MSDIDNEYFLENPISCANCIYDLVIEDYYYCTELGCEIPEGVDLGADTQCKYYKKVICKDNNSYGDGGRKAVSSGKTAEHIIGCLLDERGYSVKYRYTLPFVKGIWGNKVQVDIFCQGIPKFPNGLIIESKRQDSSGTAYQKIPYEIENIKACYPCETLLIIDGDFMKNNSIGLKVIQWAKSKSDNKLVAVYTLDEFIHWVINNFIC